MTCGWTFYETIKYQSFGEKVLTLNHFDIPLTFEFWHLDFYLEELSILHLQNPIRHGRPFLAVGDQDDGLSLLIP